MAKKEFLDVAKKVAKNMENAAVNADGASADAINAVQQEETQPQKPVEPIINPNLVADAAQKVNPRPEGVDVGKMTIPQDLVDKANEAAAQVEKKAAEASAEAQKTPEQKEEEQLIASQQAQEKTIADVIEDLESQRRQAQEEGAAREKEAKRNAAWAGATEMASAIANLIAVGHGAKSQSYKSVTQDWMQKADAEAKESRSRVQDLRNRQNETKLKMDQLRQSNILALQNLRRQQEAEKADREYRAAQTEYQKARTEAERAEAEIKMKKAAAEIEALEALAKQRIMSGNASLIKANNPTQKGGSNKKDAKKEAGEQLPPEPNSQPTGYAWNGPGGSDWKFPTLKPGYGVVAEGRENPDNTGLSSYK